MGESTKLMSLIRIHDHIWQSDWEAGVRHVACQLVWNIIAQVEPTKGLPGYMKQATNQTREDG